MTIQNLPPKSLLMRDQNVSVNEKKFAHKIMTALRLGLIAFPLISLSISVWSWLKYGVDIPVYDDWRQYNTNDMGRLDLSYLLTPHNDTLYSFGLLLDSLAFRFLDGNTVAYQLISMIAVLGGLLALQWKLLSQCTQDKTLLAISFSFTLLMLQPDTYWGFQNLAYHQAVPLVCLLGILAIALRQQSLSAAPLVAAFLMASVSGLTYISGAFSALVLCAAFLIIGWVKETNYNRNILKVAAAIAVPALASTVAQLWVIVKVQHGTHRADAPMAFPWESDFWYFMLGKIGRSLLLPMSHPTLSLAATIAATVLITLIVAIGFLRLKKELNPSNQKALIITISLAAIIFVYLLLISAGRTNMRPESVSKVEDIFIYGFYRFHFFWVTLLWPWVALICLKSLRQRHPSNAFALLITSICAALWMTAIAYTAVLDSYDFFKATMKHRSEGITCVLEKIQNAGPVLCPNIDLGNIAQGIKNGRAAQASFSRTLPIFPIALGTNSPAPTYRLSEHIDAIKLYHATREPSQVSLDLATQNDPNILITVPQKEDLSRCETLNVVVSMTADESSVAQVFYMTPKHVGYSEDYSTTTSVTASNTPQTLTFTINSADGFEHEFRFDPVTASQKISIKELEIRCRSYTYAN